MNDTNDNERVNELVDKNMPLAHFFALKNCCVDRDEALSIAMEGLFAAARTFSQQKAVDLSRHGHAAKFGTYAAVCIRRRFSSYWLTCNRRKRGGGEATHVEIDADLQESMSDERAVLPDRAVIGGEDADVLRRALATMEARDVQVLKLRYGLDGGDPMDLEQAGAVLRISRERVRQIQRDAVRTLRFRVLEIERGPVDPADPETVAPFMPRRNNLLPRRAAKAKPPKKEKARP